MSKETTTKGGAPGRSPGTKRKLTREEKKQIAAIIRQAKGDRKAHTAQQTIENYQEFKEEVTDEYYKIFQ